MSFRAGRHWPSPGPGCPSLLRECLLQHPETSERCVIYGLPYTQSCMNIPDHVPSNKGSASHHHQPDSQLQGPLSDQGNSRTRDASLQLQLTLEKVPLVGRATHIALLPCVSVPGPPKQSSTGWQPKQQTLEARMPRSGCWQGGASWA